MPQIGPKKKHKTQEVTQILDPQELLVLVITSFSQFGQKTRTPFVWPTQTTFGSGKSSAFGFGGFGGGWGGCGG